MTDLTPAQLREVYDRQQITNVLHRYCRALDRRDRPMLESVFHPDSQHAMAGYKGSSLEFCGFAFDVLSRLECTMHQLSNVLIEIDGDKAGSECYFVAYHRVAADTVGQGPMAAHTPGVDEDLFIAGRYIDRLERRDGEWRIIHRTGLQDWARWEKAAARDFGDPSQGPFGTRDRNDVSYTALRFGASPE